MSERHWSTLRRSVSTPISHATRIDTVVGYHYNQTIDFVLGLGSASITNKGKELDPRLERVTTVEGFYLGIYLRL